MMQEQQQNYIKQVTIKGLWDKFDLDWELNPDVNILAGGNGMGKSTVLRILKYNLLLCKIAIDANQSEELKKEVQDKSYEVHTFVDSSIIELCNGVICSVISKNVDKEKGTGQAQISIDTKKLEEDFELQSSFFTAIDLPLKALEAVQKLSDHRVKTDLDWELHHAQIAYINYQLNIGRERDEILDRGIEEDAMKKIQALRKPRLLLIEILNKLFEETNKKVDIDSNEISFLLDNKEKLHAYKLSAGEKQILTILLRAICQNQQPAIFILDEPEASLHIDWQKKLIGLIRQLNPNVQLIIATHSPAILTEGWFNKVFNIQDLMTPTIPS